MRKSVDLEMKQSIWQQIISLKPVKISKINIEAVYDGGELEKVQDLVSEEILELKNQNLNKLNIINLDSLDLKNLCEH